MRYTIISCLLVLLLTSCTGYSRYPIDETPQIKIDESLLGIWKCTSDTNKTNFVLVQSYYKAFETIIKNSGSPEKYLESLTVDIHKEYAKKSINEADRVYYLSYYGKDMLNPKYRNFNGYLSIIDSTYFLNVNYWYIPLGNRGQQLNEFEEKGYLLLKIKNKSSDSISLSIISTYKMKSFESPEAIRAMILENKNDESLYDDPLLFYKVKSGDMTIEEAKQYVE